MIRRPAAPVATRAAGTALVAALALALAGCKDADRPAAPPAPAADPRLDQLRLQVQRSGDPGPAPAPATQAPAAAAPAASPAPAPAAAPAADPLDVTQRQLVHTDDVIAEAKAALAGAKTDADRAKATKLLDAMQARRATLARELERLEGGRAQHKAAPPPK